MRSETLLARATQIIVFLFAAFGFFLTKFAPPGQQLAQLATGFGSFASLIVLLFVAALSGKRLAGKRRKRWLIAAGLLFVVAVTTGAVYFSTLQRLVIAYPPGESERTLITGDRLTERGRRDAETWHVTPAELVYRYGSRVEMAFEPEGIAGAERILVGGYVTWVLLLAASIFCLSESALVAMMNPVGGKDRPESTAAPKPTVSEPDRAPTSGDP